MARTLSISLILAASGEIDEQASTRAFQERLSAYKAECETEEDTIADAVHAQFDLYPGASQNMPALVHGTLGRLNVQPANFKTMEEKVLAYVRENSDRAEKLDKKTKAVIQAKEEPRTRLFGIKKGVGGGVCRWSDVPESEG